MPATGESSEPGEDAPRITKFVAKPKKIGTGFVKKPAPFRAKPDTGADRERRPFGGGAGRPGMGAKPSFTKPWQERAPRPERPAAEGEGKCAAQLYVSAGGERPAYGRKPPLGGKPGFGDKPGFGNDRGERPARRDFAASGEGRPPRREFAPRAEGTAEGRPPRKTFSKPGFGADRGEGRPARREFGDARPPRREFTPRTEGTTRPPRRESGPRPFGDRPSNERAAGGAPPRRPGSFSARPRPRAGRASGGPFTPREGGGTDRRARTDGPPFRKFDAPRGDRPSRPAFGGGSSPARPASGGDRPARSAGAGGFAGKKPFGKPGAKFGAGRAGDGEAGGDVRQVQEQRQAVRQTGRRRGSTDPRK